MSPINNTPFIPAGFLVLFDGSFVILSLEKGVSGIFDFCNHPEDYCKVFLLEPVDLEIVGIVGKHVLRAVVVVQAEVSATL